MLAINKKVFGLLLSMMDKYEAPRILTMALFDRLLLSTAVSAERIKNNMFTLRLNLERNQWYNIQYALHAEGLNLQHLQRSGKNATVKLLRVTRSQCKVYLIVYLIVGPLGIRPLHSAYLISEQVISTSIMNQYKLVHHS